MSALATGRFRRVRHVIGDDVRIRAASGTHEPVELPVNKDKCRGPSFIIVDEGCSALEAIAAALSRDPRCFDRISDKTVGETVIDAIRHLRLQPGETRPDFLSAARAILQNLQDLIKPGVAYIPIDNLQVPDDVCIRIGNVVISAYSQVHGHLEDILLQRQQLHPDPEESAKLKEMIRNDILRGVYGTSPVCAEVNLEAEAGRFRGLAEREIEAVINLLRCYTFRLFGRTVTTAIGLRGSVFSARRPCIVDQPDIGLQLSLTREGALAPFFLDHGRIGYLQTETACPSLSAILTKDKTTLTQIERGIVAAIGWLGKGMNPSERAVQFLSLTIGLERLVLGPILTGKKETLARNVAFLIGEPGKRRILFDQVKCFYSLRSAIVHDALAEVPETDLIGLQDIAVGTLEAMAFYGQSLTTYEELANAIEACMFGEGLGTGNSDEP